MSCWPTSSTKCSKTWKNKTREQRPRLKEEVISTICREAKLTYCMLCWQWITLHMIQIMRGKILIRVSIINRIRKVKMDSTKTQTLYSWIRIRPWRSCTHRIQLLRWSILATRILSMARWWKSILIRMALRAKPPSASITLVPHPYFWESRRNPTWLDRTQSINLVEPVVRSRTLAWTQIFSQTLTQIIFSSNTLAKRQVPSSNLKQRAPLNMLKKKIIKKLTLQEICRLQCLKAKRREEVVDWQQSALVCSSKMESCCLLELIVWRQQA